MSQHDINQNGQHLSLLQYNLKYARFGVFIALGICALNYFQDFKISGKTIFATFLFSITISLAITNLIYLSHCLFKRRENKNVKYIIFDFVLMGIGITVATELCFFILYLLYGNWIPVSKQFPTLAFNLFLGFMIGGFRQIISLQHENYEFKLKENEYQLAKLHELKTRAELETLQSKINPHFLYNSLNSIASLIHQDADKAEEMVLKLSKLFRYSINTSDENFATIATETDIVKNYLEIEKIRLGDRLDVSIKVEEQLYEVKIPRFLLQPLVENAIKHGISRVATEGKISIEIKTLPDEHIEITVTDNGPEFPAVLEPGYGMQSTFDKLKLLYGDDHVLNILSAPHKGIQIIIPNLVGKQLAHEIY